MIFKVFLASQLFLFGSYLNINFNTHNVYDLNGTEEIPASVKDEDEEDKFMNIDEYNQYWGNSFLINSSSEFEDSIQSMTLSSVQYKTAYFLDSNGNAIEYITLKYQTEVQGGRPQFVYDTCYLSTPTSYNNWPCTYSSVSFTGDQIKVYATFTFGALEEYGTATFKPY